MADNPFEGMSFEDAVQSADTVDEVLVNGGREDQEDPFGGMSFDQAAGEAQEKENAEKSKAMQILDGTYVPPKVDVSNDPLLQSVQDGLSPTDALDKVKEDEDEAVLQEAEAYRSKVAGDPGGFVSGRHGVPRGQDVEDVKAKIENSGGDFRHKIKLGAERFALSTAEFIDFIDTANEYLTNPLPSFGIGERVPDDIIIDGKVIALDYKFKDAAKQIIKNTYSALGMDDKLEEVESQSDIPIKLLSENLGPSGLIAGGLKVVDKAAGLAGSATKFLREEFKYAVGGTVTGTTASGIAGGTIEDREGISEVFNLIGMVGAPVLAEIPSIKAAVAFITKQKKTVALFESENAYAMTKDSVLKHIRTFVPDTEIPAIVKRMEIVRRVQKLEPDFQPTVGNMIGTTESRQIQRITDSKNYKFASERYAKTKKAVERLTKRLQVETDPSQKALIVSALREYSTEAHFHVLGLQDRLITLEEQVRRVNRGDTRGVDAGKDIRSELTELKKTYQKAVDDVFAKVDPEETAKFDATGLIRTVKKLSDSNELDRVLDEADAGFNLITKTLPRYIKATAERSKTSSDIIIVPDSLKNQETAYLSFTELKKLRTAVLGRAVKIARKDPSSNAPRILNDIAEELDTMIDTKMLQGDPGVAKRYAEARQFTSDEFYSRFRESVGGALLKQQENTGDFAVKAEDIGPMFWRRGAKEGNLEEFQKIFANGHPGLKDKGLPEEKLDEIAEGISQVAREHLKGYALRTLQDKLDASPTKSPLQVIKAWETEYKGVLETFTDIADEVDTLKTQFTTFEADKVHRIERIRKINLEVVEKYADPEQSTLLANMLKDSVSLEDVQKTYRDILRASDVNHTSRTAESSDAMANLYPETVDVSMDLTDPHIREVRRAMQEGLTADILSKAYDPEAQGPSWQKLDKLLHDNKDKLRVVFSEGELESLEDFNTVLRLLGAENKPIGIHETNELKEVMQRVGISPASILSRYYSAALGKVGPVYLATDALTRVFTGVSQKHFDKVYKETMYDLNGLEQVLKQSGDAKTAEVVAKTTDMLKKQGVKGLKKMRRKALTSLFNAHILAVYGRASATFDSIEERQEGFSVEKSQEDLLNMYLKMNDDYTGQPSRIFSYTFDDESEEDILSGFENESVEDAEPIIPDQEALKTEEINREGILDKETGEITWL